MAPSLVTWPTSSVDMPRSLDARISAPATSRTCATPPGAPSISGEADRLHRVQHQQTGFTSSSWPSTEDRSVSAAR